MVCTLPPSLAATRLAAPIQAASGFAAGFASSVSSGTGPSALLVQFLPLLHPAPPPPSLSLILQSLPSPMAAHLTAGSSLLPKRFRSFAVFSFWLPRAHATFPHASCHQTIFFHHWPCHGLMVGEMMIHHLTTQPNLYLPRLPSLHLPPSLLSSCTLACWKPLCKTCASKPLVRTPFSCLLSLKRAALKQPWMWTSSRWKKQFYQTNQLWKHTCLMDICGDCMEAWLFPPLVISHQKTIMPLCRTQPLEHPLPSMLCDQSISCLKHRSLCSTSGLASNQEVGDLLVFLWQVPGTLSQPQSASWTCHHLAGVVYSSGFSPTHGQGFLINLDFVIANLRLRLAVNRGTTFRRGWLLQLSTRLSRLLFGLTCSFIPMLLQDRWWFGYQSFFPTRHSSSEVSPLPTSSPPSFHFCTQDPWEALAVQADLMRQHPANSSRCQWIRQQQEAEAQAKRARGKSKKVAAEAEEHAKKSRKKEKKEKSKKEKRQTPAARPRGSSRQEAPQGSPTEAGKNNSVWSSVDRGSFLASFEWGRSSPHYSSAKSWDWKSVFLERVGRRGECFFPVLLVLVDSTKNFVVIWMRCL